MVINIFYLLLLYIMITTQQINQVLILSEVQIIIARTVHDEKKFNEINERINEVKQMILETINPNQNG